jgi:trimethylamine-N-oxide reductase cytochrome c-type subunit TorC
MTEQSVEKGKRRGWLTKAAIGMFVAGGLLTALLFVGFDVVAHVTESNKFCTSCHSMRDNFAEYQGTVHFQNRMGVQAKCSDCHVAEGGLPLLADKIRASSDVFHHLIGTVGTPQKFEARREIMANAVWDKMKSNDSRECRSCHSFANMDLLSQRPSARKYHAIAQKQGATCIDCHKGIAHFLPITSDGSAGASKLLEAAKAVPASATHLFAVQTTPLYLTNDTNDKNQGRVMPSAPVERVGQDGELLKVRITGWRQVRQDPVLRAGQTHHERGSVGRDREEGHGRPKPDRRRNEPEVDRGLARGLRRARQIHRQFAGALGLRQANDDRELRNLPRRT